MNVPDSSAVDDAIVTTLSSDPTLTQLLPGGVAFDIAAQGATAFVIVTLMHHEDHYSMVDAIDPASLIERSIYLVKAVNQNASGSVVRQGAHRIHQLLEGGALAATGYTLMKMERIERVRYTEVDHATTARWQHRGGHYEVWVTPMVAAGVLVRDPLLDLQVAA
jgi:hypothetical protein